MEDDEVADSTLEEVMEKLLDRLSIIVRCLLYHLRRFTNGEANYLWLFSSSESTTRCVASTFYHSCRDRSHEETKSVCLIAEILFC